MNTELVQDFAGLGFCSALQGMIKNTTPRGRLLLLTQNLEKAAKKWFRNHTTPSFNESLAAQSVAMKVCEKSGWNNTEVSIPAYCNFTLLILDESRMSNLREILKEIHCYFDRVGNVNDDDYCEAERAFDIWERILDENFSN